MLIKISFQIAVTSPIWNALKRSGTRNTRDREILKFWSFLSELVKRKLFVMKAMTPFGIIIFCNGNNKNYPLTIELFSHGDLMTSFLLLHALGNVLLSSFLCFLCPFFIVTRKVSFATLGLFIFASFCSRLSLVWVVLLSGVVWRLNLISKINITNITCLLSPEGRTTEL